MLAPLAEVDGFFSYYYFNSPVSINNIQEDEFPLTEWDRIINTSINNGGKNFKERLIHGIYYGVFGTTFAISHEILELFKLVGLWHTKVPFKFQSCGTERFYSFSNNLIPADWWVQCPMP